MNAIQFIKENGVEKARDVVVTCHKIPNYTFKEKTERGYSSCKSVDISDLKRLVKSIDLVEFEGGLDKAKNVLFLKRALGLTPHADRLEQAIADYEQLFGNTETLELETLLDCDTSPNCKKFDERVK